MDFEEFYKKHIKAGSINYYKFSKEGYDIMKKSHDPLHDNHHIDNLLISLNIFLKDNKKMATKINLNVLFLAMCWHDCWKATLRPKNIFFATYAQATEGIRSYIIFHKKAKKYMFSERFIKEVGYAIRKHSSLQILPTKTYEAKLLQDLDELDVLNIKRFKHAIKKRSFLNKRRNIFLTKVYIKKISPSTCHFDWTRRMIIKNKEKFFDRFDKVTKNI